MCVVDVVSGVIWVVARQKWPTHTAARQGTLYLASVPNPGDKVVSFGASGWYVDALPRALADVSRATLLRMRGPEQLSFPTTHVAVSPNGNPCNLLICNYLAADSNPKSFPAVIHSQVRHALLQLMHARAAKPMTAGRGSCRAKAVANTHLVPCLPIPVCGCP